MRKHLWLLIMTFLLVPAAVWGQTATPTPTPGFEPMFTAAPPINPALQTPTIEFDELTEPLFEEDVPVEPTPTAPLPPGSIPCTDVAPAGANAPYFVGVGNAYFEDMDYTRAIAAYTCALNLDSSYAPAYVKRGYAYASLRDDVSAVADYNRALELDEMLIEGYNNRGLLYAAQGNFGLAITDFTVAVLLNPDYALAYQNRGIIHAAEGNYDLAVADIQAAIDLYPQAAAPHAALGAVYLALAAASYQQYADIAGVGAPVPGGDAPTMLRAINTGAEVGDVSTWLALLAPSG